MRSFFSALNLWTETEEDSAQATAIIESSNALQDQVFRDNEKAISDFAAMDEKQRIALQESRVTPVPRKKETPADSAPQFTVEQVQDPEPIINPSPDPEPIVEPEPEPIEQPAP